MEIEKGKKRQNKLKKSLNVCIGISLVIAVILQMIESNLLFEKEIIKQAVINIFKRTYPFLFAWYHNIIIFAGNSFTQITAFFSAFATLSFFVIGRFKEGIVGIPLEELLDTVFDRTLTERMRKFALFSPMIVCFFIILGAQIMAFYVGMLTLMIVIFSAYCAAIATDKDMQKKIAVKIVMKEIKEKSKELENEVKQTERNKPIYVIVERYQSKAILKMGDTMKKNHVLLEDLGKMIFNFLLDKKILECNYASDVVFYNIEGLINCIYEDNRELAYVFAFLRTQIQEIAKLSADKDNESMQTIYDSAIMGIICGVISSNVKGSKEFIEDMFDESGESEWKVLQRLNVLLYIEYLYHTNSQVLAKEWSYLIMTTKVKFFGEEFKFLLKNNRNYFLRYIILWETKRKGIRSIDLDIFYHLETDICNIQQLKGNSFIGYMLKERRRIGDEKKYM